MNFMIIKNLKSKFKMKLKSKKDFYYFLFLNELKT